ncbi:hypothetical protein KKA93_02520 [Patescibacteria group bacterium]|nr:hypothetical protein [Patescibacteria group bacterium]MBU1663703.1 hypothetical protein [Patescibacteria group bacterium]MBU2233355.1 hypothetical protein [Patescibacteria group bacterium]MBU2264153.1 hypothetical protein [Patescibacteria group bacterium]
MNKNLIIAISGIVVVAGVAGFILLNKNNSQLPVDSECSQLCASAKTACPSLIDQKTCETKCPKFSQETKEHLLGAKSCEALTQKPELISELLIPEIKKPEQKEVSSDCEAACGKYVMSCLTAEEMAIEVSSGAGGRYNSCLKKCSDWSADKIECMITAFDCEAMTDKCGL